jgi:glycosyltransferase involved in cell wall biosynthesis
MNKILYFLSILTLCFGQKLNFAPKIKNPKGEKAIVILIPSYNNERFFEDNLTSVINQKYKNFRVVYTNDASTDKTGELVIDFMEKNFDIDRFTYMENKMNMGALYNIYHMVHNCKNEEVVCILDGDDKFFHNKVLQRINQAYADDSVWMTYGQDFCRIKKAGHSLATPYQVLKQGEHRKLSYRWSALRTYYAGLFKQVPKEKWLTDQSFFPFAQDIAQVLFLIDLAREHVFFIPEILYVYNVENPINDFKKNLKEQIKYRNLIWNLPPLEKLNSKDDFL